ncbi:MAG TPA: hypothetical protein VHP63_05955 [candidate division Zixibacteria bacterium]|nr:hypothetical protein [candidate division Zixibacteria bacterium]
MNQEMSQGMPQGMPQPEKKGLSKGCTVALIIGGVAVVLIAAVIIVLVMKGKDVAKWAFVQAIENEKTMIMQSQIPGIDTVAVNSVADGFKQKLESPDFDFQQVMSFQGFVQQYATDNKVDSLEAVSFVDAMVECYPDLESLYMPAIIDDTASMAE